MNSITPISSLSSSALSLLNSESDKDLIEAVETIERRSRNLLVFVENYKKLSQIPKPDKSLISVNTLIQRINSLMATYIEESNTKLNIDINDKNLMLYIDIPQIEQILINLIKNSVEASSSEILISGDVNNESGVIISISDNGSGFSNESEEKAFIPFYTTKSAGSGLGLSITRQIMNMHGGDVDIKTDDSGSRISLLFP